MLVFVKGGKPENPEIKGRSNSGLKPHGVSGKPE